MTTRELPREEWHRLAGTELEPYVHDQPDGVLAVLVVEDGDQIIGCWSILTLVHVEGVWIDPAHRKHGAVARQLLGAMWRRLRSLGVRAVLTGAVTTEVEQLLARLGAARVPYIPYIWPCRRSVEDT